MLPIGTSFMLYVPLSVIGSKDWVGQKVVRLLLGDVFLRFYLGRSAKELASSQNVVN